MLSHNEIENKIGAGEITISYSFLPGEDGSISYFPDEEMVDIQDGDKPATKYFKKQLWSDRLKISLGPILQSHEKEEIKGRHYLEKHKGCFNINEIGNVILEPFETLSIASNERVKLGKSVSALVLPRITNADAGIILTTAYIDPYWDGTLQMVIKNSTAHHQELRMMESIAQCFFFSIEGDVADHFRDVFPGKSHHYGQNWKKILDEDFPPFPRRKSPNIIPNQFANNISKIKFFLKNNFFSIATTLTVLITVVTLAKTYGAITMEIELFKEERKKVANLTKVVKEVKENTIPDILKNLKGIEGALPLVGVERVLLPAGKSYVGASVIVNELVQGDATIIVTTEDQDINSNIKTYGGFSTNKSSKQTVIDMEVYAKDVSQNNRLINLHWVIIR